MLVRSVKDFKDYTGTRTIPSGGLYIVYARERDENGKQLYYILPLGVKFKSDEYDPLFFAAENFEIVSDLTSTGWIKHDVHVPRGTTEYNSFPEWFENNFYIRAHDWNLEGDDYRIVNKYKQEYEQLYEDYMR